MICRGEGKEVEI